MNEEQKGLHVTIINLKDGTQVFENVKAVRIHSDKYRVLIMQDHAPILGKVNGDLYIVQESGETVFENVEGFYTNVKNEFKFVEEDE